MLFICWLVGPSVGPSDCLSVGTSVCTSGDPSDSLSLSFSVSQLTINGDGIFGMNVIMWVFNRIMKS